MRRPALLIAIAALIAPAPPAAAANSDVVGGADTPITAVPYQAALLTAGGGQVYCGGTIVDATHVLTAAHCAVDSDTGATYPASATRVLVGTSDIADRAAPAQLLAVSTVEVHPAYDASSGTGDAALLTLAAPIALDGVHTVALPLSSATPPTGTSATISGWGTTRPLSASQQGLFGNNDPSSRTLKSTTVEVLDDFSPTCGPAYGFSGSDAAAFLCAAHAGRDTCQGDSGGPLAAGGQLIGIVAFGAGCADPGYAGVYTDVAPATIRDFVSARLVRPANTVGPLLSGTPRAGETLTCGTGSWSPEPAGYRYAFVSGSALLRDFSASPTYVLGPADVNRTIGCVVEARAATGGSAQARSNTVGPVQPATTTPPPTTTTATTPRITTADTTAPDADVVSRRCTRTVCRVAIEVDDRGFSTGVADVVVTYVSRYRVSCRRNHRRTTCARSTRGTAEPVRTGSTSFVVRLTKLHAGSTTSIAVRAVDRAGNRQRYATRAQLRTTRATRRR